MSTLSRRSFLGANGIVLVGCFLDSMFSGAEALAAPAPAIDLNAWIKIAADDTVTVVVSQAEMGQGIMTTLPAVLVEELGARWERVQFETSPAAVAYRNPRLQWQFTGNSESISSFFDLMRKMGASARAMLVEAAARKWGIPAASCKVEDGYVIDSASQRRESFGALAPAASKIAPPKEPRLKPEREWKLLGKPLPRVDNPAKVDGSAIFGLDFMLPGMVHAAILNCPVFGGKLVSIDRSSVAGEDGLLDVIEVPGGVATVAKTYWQARKALDALRVVWDEGPHARVDSKSLMGQYHQAMAGDDWVPVKAVGGTFPTAHSAEYESQFLAHATMEPMNATAHVTSEGCEIWAPTQGQELAQVVASTILGLPKEKVQVHRTFLGGGFGRRLLVDYVVQAVVLAKAVGRPVKAIWSREEDMRHDHYRPAVLHRMAAGFDKDGYPIGIAHRLVSPTILKSVFPPAVTDKLDPSCLEGLMETHYRIPNVRIDFHLLSIPVPTSVARTTGYGPNLFAMESFLDEAAHRAKKDPYAYRRHLLGGNPRALAVLDLAADKARWREAPPAGVHRGIAFAEAFNTMICQVVELSVQDGRVTIHRVVSAVDCGTVLNPNIAENNIEGGVAWGLSNAFKSEMTFSRGKAVEGNFDGFQILRLPEMPPCETHFIDSGARPLGGTGEVGPVTVIPAVTNAIFAATGRRIRSLPLARHGLHLG
ncbi:molybdopterin-dependent oxidoreductase [Pendulispora rubella]|uniref:Molybdopterin-dependent oxidoreductase n=1 Tax=Pendulispora rubella TaxID=2741070 RepID=A0ABZ2KX81_9BACT